MSRPPHHNVARPLRLYSRIGETRGNRQVRGLPQIDGRTRAGRAAKAFRQDLIEHWRGAEYNTARDHRALRFPAAQVFNDGREDRGG